MDALAPTMIIGRPKIRKFYDQFMGCGDDDDPDGRSTPIFGDSALSRVSINSIEFAHASPSRFQWVMNLDAFHANRKSRGV